MSYSELYVTCADAFEDQAPLKGKGLLVKEFPEKVVVAVTADEPVEFELEGLMGCTIEPFYFYIWKNGWLATILAPDGGPIMGRGMEDELIRIIGGRA
jgi:hypothetical protein